MKIVYVDETGNTGRKLSDREQPVFRYGLLVTKGISEQELEEIVNGVPGKTPGKEIKGSRLSGKNVGLWLPKVKKWEEGKRITFDQVVIEKKALGLCNMYECLFDAGLNEEMNKVLYWTGVKTIGVRLLGSTMREETLEEWDKLTLGPESRRMAGLNNIIARVREEIETAIDRYQGAEGEEERIQGLKILHKAVVGAERNKDAVDWSIIGSRRYSPNIWGMRFAMQLLARHCVVGEKIKMVLDEQVEFEQTQREASDLVRRVPPFLETERGTIDHPMLAGFGDREMLRRIPHGDVEHINSKDSAGVQLTDLYLAITDERKHLAKPIRNKIGRLNSIQNGGIEGTTLRSLKTRGLMAGWELGYRSLELAAEIIHEERSGTIWTECQHRQ